MPDIPKIKKVSEIGETPFRVVRLEEKILQGWDKTARKMLYLFKDEMNQWAYYDKATNQTVEVSQWRDKEALIRDRWIKMSLYYRLHVVFEAPITYSVFHFGQGSQQFQTWEAIILIPKTAYEQLVQQMTGRPEESFYKFNYKKLKKGDTIENVQFVR